MVQLGAICRNIGKRILETKVNIGMRFDEKISSESMKLRFKNEAGSKS